MVNKLVKAWTWIDDKWLEGNPPIMGSMTQSTWLGSLVFDGARRINGKTPDLDKHCERLINSANCMNLTPPKSSQEVFNLCIEGCSKFTENEDLYIKPMIWAEDGLGVIAPDPDSSKLAVCIFEAPIPNGGMNVCMSDFIRPLSNSAPTDAKASALYASTGRAMKAALDKGFDNCILCDHEGYVAEFTVANLFMVKNKKVYTPKPTGTFLNGITKQRVVKLLSDTEFNVIESKIKPEDLFDADEIFASGNYVKIRSVARYENKVFTPGPVYQLAKKLYWKWAGIN